MADVVNFGGLVKQYHVITSPDRLQRYNLSVQNVIDAITANNLNTGGNIIQRGEQGFVVRGIGAIHTKDDIKNIVVTSAMEFVSSATWQAWKNFLFRPRVSSDTHFNPMIRRKSMSIQAFKA